MRWEDHTDCELRRGHVGAHLNLQSGFTWWGQIMLNHVPGSVADKHSRFDAPVKPISPDWADETQTIIRAAFGEELQSFLPDEEIPPPAPASAAKAAPDRKPLAGGSDVVPAGKPPVRRNENPYDKQPITQALNLVFVAGLYWVLTQFIHSTYAFMIAFLAWIVIAIGIRQQYQDENQSER
jgi:hypothetical protein